MLWSLVAACVTAVPRPEPETSKEMIRELANEPPAVPEAPVGAGPAADATATDVTMEGLHGTAAGTRVRVDGFLVGTDEGKVHVSADSEGKTVLLRCDGGALAVAGVAARTPVRVTGTVAAPDGDEAVLSACQAEVTGRSPVDPERPGQG